MMDVSMQALLRLVHNALTDQAEPLPEGCSMEQVAKLAIRHQVEVMAYDGALRCGYTRKEPGVAMLFERCCKGSVKNDLQMRALKKLYAAFEEAQIDYMPLKGCIMKEMYPRPELRAMNDADILIRLEQYDTIKTVLQTLGFQFLAESDCELKWGIGGLYLELHKRLIPSFIKDFYAYFGEGWHLAHRESGSRFAMSKEDEFLFIFTHFARHYREGGVGIRHMADIWLYRRKNPELDEERIVRALRGMSLDVFYANVLQTLDNWFDGGAETQMTRRITDYIESSGSFGNEENKGVADDLRKTKGKGKGAVVLRMLFPSLANMSFSYPVLKKCPVLLPVMWVVRWFRVLFLGKGKLKTRSKQLSAMSGQKMDAFEQSLREVGLGMEFEET